MKACCNGLNRGMSEHLQDESVNKPLGMVHAMFVKARSAVCFSGIINLHVCPKKFNRGTSLITMIIKSVISKNMLNDLYIYNMYSLSAIFLKISSVTKKKLCWKTPKTKPDRLTYRQVKGILLSIQRVACGIKKNVYEKSIRLRNLLITTRHKIWREYLKSSRNAYTCI